MAEGRELHLCCAKAFWSYEYCYILGKACSAYLEVSLVGSDFDFFGFDWSRKFLRCTMMPIRQICVLACEY